MRESRFKLSKFTSLIEVSPNKYLAFNSRTCALAELSEDSLNLIKSASPAPITMSEEEIERNKLALYGFFVPEGVDEIRYLISSYWEKRHDKSALTLILLPTMSCNFDCYYCYEKKNLLIMQDDVAEGILNLVKGQLKGIKSLNIGWYGGEPLLEWKRICSMSSEFKALSTKQGISYSASIISNCYLLHPDIADKLFDSGVDTLQVSFDGPRGYHDAIKNSGGRPSFDITVKNVKYALDRWDVRIRVNITRENLPLIPLLIDQLADHGLNNGSIIYFATVDGIRHKSNNRSLNWAEKIISPQEFHPHHLKLVKKAARSGFNVGLSLSPPYICSALRIGTCMIEPDGQAKKCINDISYSSAEAAHSSNLNAAILKDESLDRWARYDPFNEKACLSCFVLPVCLGGCPWMSLSGLPLDSRCSILKENYKDYLRMIYHLSDEGILYDPDKMVLKKKDI